MLVESSTKNVAQRLFVTEEESLRIPAVNDAMDRLLSRQTLFESTPEFTARLSPHPSLPDVLVTVRDGLVASFAPIGTASTFQYIDAIAEIGARLEGTPFDQCGERIRASAASDDKVAEWLASVL